MRTGAQIIVNGIDRAYYLAAYHDVAAAGVDPSAHYDQFGWSEGRMPNGLFNTTYYLDNAPDVLAAGVNPLRHYLHFGAGEGRDPSGFFDTSAYLAAYRDVADAGVNPLAHFLHHGVYEGRAAGIAYPAATGQTDFLFGTAASDSIDAGGGDDIVIGAGGNDMLDGGSGIDTVRFAHDFADYTFTFSNGEITVSGPEGLDTLAGFERFAFKDATIRNDDGNAYVDDLFYYANNPDVWAAGVDAATHYAQFGWKEGRNPNAYFDTDWYLANYPDVAAAGVNPLQHYAAYGAAEGRDPSPRFDTSAYLAANPDVAAAGVNPLMHFLVYGINEGRSPLGGIPNTPPGPPTSLALSNASVNEAAVIGTVVGTFSTSEQGAFTYTLIEDADDAFVIAGNVLRLNKPLDFESIPGGQLTIQARVTDANGSSYGRSFTIAVEDALDGFASDGYIAGASLFHDADGDFQLSPGEIATVSDAKGNYVLPFGPGRIVLTGGTDIATGLPFRGFMAAPQNASIVSPLTTLIVAGATNAQVLAALGLDAGIDLPGFDPIAATLSSDPITADIGAAAIRAAVQVQNILTQSAALLTGAGATDTQAGQAIAEALAFEAINNGPLDLTDSVLIGDILENAIASIGTLSIPQALIDGTGTIVGATNAAAENAGGGGEMLLTGLTQVAIVADASADEIAAADESSIGDVEDAYSGASLDSKIAAAESAVEDVQGSNAAETLNGTGGPDLLQGFGGDDVLNGLEGSDILVGGPGDDTIDAGDGKDILIGGPGDDDLDGGAWYDNVSAAGGGDFDRVSYANAIGAVTIDLAVGTASGMSVGSDTLTHIEGVIGGSFDDQLFGGGNDFIEAFRGGGGDDHVDGRDGTDRAEYIEATAGITVDLAAGTVNGAAGGVGIDTIRSVEQIAGSSFDDTFDATGFGPSSTNAGSRGTYNSFRPNGGNDTIIGNGDTELDYLTSSAAVTVDLTAGVTTGGLDVGTDTFSGVNRLRGSSFADVLIGGQAAYSAPGSPEFFEGLGGDDLMDGGSGFDYARYYVTSAIPQGVSVINPIDGQAKIVGIHVQMADGIVTGDPIQFGTDTLRGIEGVRGTVLDDIYDATGFGLASLNAPSPNIPYNEFEGGAGDDIIIGNGSTRASYLNATSGVLVDISGNGSGTVTGDASVGTDTITGGVLSVRGSAFDDTFTGFDNAQGTVQYFDGRGGDDLIDGRGGLDQVDYGADSTVTGGITIDVANGTAANTNPADDSVGTDTLRSVEFFIGTSFDDIFNAAGFDFGSPNAGSNGSLNQFEGGGGNDTVTGNGDTRVSFATATAGVTAALGAGGSGTATGDASVGTDTFVSGVDKLRGSTHDDTLTGNGGNNTLEGRDGNDVLDGGGGIDGIVGGAGDDQLTGGPGNDTFSFLSGDIGHDTILDFTGIGAAVGDRAHLSGFSAFDEFQDVLDAMQQQGDDVLIMIDADTSITVENATIAQFHQSDFVFT